MRLSEKKKRSRDGGRTNGQRSKKAQKQRKTLFLLDETGFYLLPGVAKSYAKQGERFQLRVKLSNDHLSSIGGVTPCGQVSIWTKTDSLNATDSVWFLRHLLQRFERVLVVWDGSPIHSRSVIVREFIANVGHRKLTVETFPGYAPDLNPAEGLWEHLKHVELRNICAADLAELNRHLQAAVNRVRLRPELIQSFFGQPKLDISEFKNV